MSDINKFLENNCGITNETNIIEKELNKKGNIDIEKKNWDKYNIQKYDLETEEEDKDKCIIFFENHFSDIQQIFIELELKNEFYLYLKGNCYLSNLSNQIEDLENIIKNKRTYYKKINKELEKVGNGLKKKHNSINEKELKTKLNQLIKKKNNKNQNIENLPPFEVISLQDEIDKIDKEIKNMKTELNELPNIIKEIEIETKENISEIDKNNRYINIINKFPIKLYHNFIQEREKQIEITDREKKNQQKIIRQNKIYMSVVFLTFICNIFFKNYDYIYIYLILSFSLI